MIPESQSLNRTQFGVCSGKITDYDKPDDSISRASRSDA